MSTPSPTGLAAEFCERVRAATEGTPYRVTPTADGFELAVDIANPYWRGELHHRHVERVFTHHVAVDPKKRRFVVTDDLHELEWKTAASGPEEAPEVVLGARVSRFRGRAVRVSFTKSVGRGADGSLEVGDVYRFSSEDGRRLIRRAAGELGLIEGYSTEQKIGLVVALIGGAGAAAALVTLAIVALLR